MIHGTWILSVREKILGPWSWNCPNALRQCAFHEVNLNKKGIQYTSAILHTETDYFGYCVAEIPTLLHVSAFKI